MLVVTRKIGQEIVIGKDVHVTVVAIRGEEARLGITAPKDVVVDREEVHQARSALAKTLHVANLTGGVNDSDLEALFAPHGTVQSAQVVMDPDTGCSKGFGFVEMATCDQAQAAITALSGKDSNGKTLTVNKAVPQIDPMVVVATAAITMPI